MVDFLVDIQVELGDVNRIFTHMEHAVGMVELGIFLETEVDLYLRKRITQRFAGEGDDVVGKWLPLAPATEKIRASKGYPPAHPINARTHYMEDFLVGQPGSVLPVGPAIVLTHPAASGGGLMDQKIETAQKGRGNPQTPPRPVLGLNEADLAFIHFQLVHHLFAGLK